MDLKKYYGFVVAEAQSCNTCHCEKSECVKLDIPDIGQFCLVEDSKQNLIELLNTNYDLKKKCNELQRTTESQYAIISGLETVNGNINTELKSVEKSRDELSNKLTEALADNKRMHNQSLWERIFNR